MSHNIRALAVGTVQHLRNHCCSLSHGWLCAARQCLAGFESVSPATSLPVTACCQQGWLGVGAPVRWGWSPVARGDTGGGWEAPGHVKVALYFLYSYFP